MITNWKLCREHQFIFKLLSASFSTSFSNIKNDDDSIISFIIND